jgi:hypothetical protein
MLEQISGTTFCGVNKNTQRRNANLEIMFCGFPREKRHAWTNYKKEGLVHSGYNIVYPIIQFFLFLLTILNQTQY